MKTTSKLAVAILASVLAMSARATPTTYDFTLTATGFGTFGPVFGIGGLPAGPFHGSFSLDEPLTPSQTLLPVTFTAFSVTVGSLTWTLADIVQTFVSTDAAGDVDPTGKVFIEALHDPTGTREVLSIVKDFTTNVGWYAVDPSAATFCGFATSPPLVGPISGGCIGGGPGTVTIAERAHETPEPATLLLTSLGLLALAARRRR